MFWLLVGIAAIAVGVLVWGEWKASPVRLVAKPIASLAFIAAGIDRGAFDSTYGRIMLVGLVLAAFGDVFLLGDTRGTFLAGLVSFLLGHVAYSVAFATFGLWNDTRVNFAWTAVVALPLAVVVYLVLRWLKPHLADDMRGPVFAYVFVITVMVLTAFIAKGAGGKAWIPTGAIGFFLSDLAVARNQFVTESIVNRAWGLPLYYASQFVLAWTIGA